jgi:hypothetical protein
MQDDNQDLRTGQPEESQSFDPGLAAMLDETNKLLAEAQSYVGQSGEDSGEGPAGSVEISSGVAPILDVANKMIGQAQGVAEGRYDPEQLEVMQRIAAEHATEQAAYEQQQAEEETETQQQDAAAEKGVIAGGAYPSSFDPNLAALLGQANQVVTDAQAHIGQVGQTPSASAPLVDPSIAAAMNNPASAPMTDSIASTLNMTNTAMGHAQGMAQGQYTPEQMNAITQRYDHTSNLLQDFLQEQEQQRALADHAEEVQRNMMDDPFPQF